MILFEPQPDWFADAKCNGMDPDIWFPIRGDNKGTRRAKAICRECPVIGACLAYGMKERVGVYGGKSALERQLMRRARRVA